MENPAIIELKNLGILIGPFAIPLVLGLFIRWRTGSFLTVLSRLWSLFHGKATSTVPAIKEYLESQSAVMHLVFSSGAKIRTEQHAKRMIEWSKMHDESIEGAARCGPYFDWELPGLNESRKRKPGPSLATAAILLTFACFLLGITLYDKSIVRVKGTDTWFGVTASYAQPLPRGPQLIFRDCNAGLANKSQKAGFSTEDVKLICEVFSNEKTEELATYLEKNLREQKIIAGVYCIVCLLLMCFPVRTLAQQENAKQMHERARKKAQSRSPEETQRDSANVD